MCKTEEKLNKINIKFCKNEIFKQKNEIFVVKNDLIK